MATEVVMPQMGESIAEGTVTKWLKKVGERVERDEPLLEISTDKVDTVIPSPSAGTITAIKVEEGQTVPINTVIAELDGAGGKAAAPAAPAPARAAAAPPPPPKPAPAPLPPRPAAAPAPAPTALATAPPPAPRPAPAPVAAPVPAPVPAGNGQQLRPAAIAPAGSGRFLTSPLVKRIAREENIDLRQVQGTGLGGRVTRVDIMNFVETRNAGGAAAPAAPAPAPPRPAAPATAAPSAAPSPAWEAQVMAGDRVENMTTMRRLIAEHMVYSKRTSPHVYTMFEFDMTNIVQLRAKEKEAFDKAAGVKLTYMPFVARAVTHALKKNPLVNSSVRGSEVVYHNHVNLGIAVALENGLIVPVVKSAEEKSFLGLARSIADLAERARGKRLSPDDVTEGTFTITNPGVFGSLIGFAVINQPQVGILDMGAIVKRPVVMEVEGTDAIVIRHIQLMSISYDHRVVDGATADHFMNDMRDYLSGWSEPLL
jgi:2-oxoglutarate dehydrogenase E2 component (dihydrolipoamide succinyltransferase)